MPSFWQADPTYRQHARLVASQKRKAEKCGDRDAALFLLQEFVNHADIIERERGTIPHSDKLVIRFLVRAVREILNGRHPKQALCLDAEGRPKVSISRNLALAVLVHKKYQELKDRAKAENGGPVNWAIAAVARERKIGKATVLAAWKEHGGLKGVSDFLAEAEKGLRGVKQSP